MRPPRTAPILLGLLGPLVLQGCITTRLRVEMAPVRKVAFARLIPAIDEPEFATVSEAARFMRDDEPVLGVAEPQPKAYSLWMLDRHEIVDDGPVAATWCPLAGCAMVYSREAAGRTLTFRVSGRLWRNALLLEDRETGTLWSQIDGSAIAGPLAGERLETVASARMTWGEWRRLHPDTLVLKKEWYDRKGRSDYTAYDADGDRLGIFGDENPDPRLPGKMPVLGLDADGSWVAIPLSAVTREGPLQETVGHGCPLLVAEEPGGVSARAFSRCVDGAALSFEATGATPGALVDKETGSTWDLATLRATAGPLCGRALEAIPGQTIYWFVWASFHPETEILLPGAPEKIASR